MRRRTLPIAVAAATLACTRVALAQATPGTAQDSSSRKFEITDNSFLVEESFNQEPGIFQNIFTWTRSRDGEWQASFTQEWPAPGVTHQFSYTIPFSGSGRSSGVNDVSLNYRYQLLREASGPPAISPRLSLILPTGYEADGPGTSVLGLQFNGPVSKQFGNLYVHANGGGTWRHHFGWTPHVAGSGIWRVTPMFNLMLEGLVEFDESATLSPGFRRGWNVGDAQLVVGAALPVTRAESRNTVSLLTYLSYELPFR